MNPLFRQEGLSQMTLKILYTVDNEPNYFLARSKMLLPVSVESVPSNSSHLKSPLRIGVIELSHVLNVVYKSSPELFPFDNSTLDTTRDCDYNVYFKDVVEADEPFVSLGLLSKLRNNAYLEQEQLLDGKNQAEDTPLVIGRVCTNFASLLTMSGNGNPSRHETLEVKMKFSNVNSSTSTRKSSFSKAQPAKRMNSYAGFIPASGVTKPAPIPTAANGAITKSKKREMNQMPAPKAFRTQSLPIWENPKYGGIRGGTIAHKIYMADRSKESSSCQQFLPQSGIGQERRPTYQVTSLQSDSTVTRFHIDDSVSKRFEFMNKPKAKKPSSYQQKPPNNISSFGYPQAKKHTYKHKPVSAARNSIERPNSSSASNSKQENMSKEFNIISDEMSLQDMVHPLQHQDKNDESIFELANAQVNTSEIVSDKENVPPIADSTPQPSLQIEMEDFFSFDLENVKHSEDEWLQGMFGTPRDVNTCNTIPIEEDNEDDQGSIALTHSGETGLSASATKRQTDFVYDTDRTSPIDTLSMPIMDLEPSANQQARFVSCADQLKRLPLLSGGKCASTEKHTPADDELADEDDDATSPVEQVSTSPANPRSAPQISENSHKRTTFHDMCSDSDDDDEDNLQSIKKRKAMPSSPTSMYQPYKKLHSSISEHPQHGSPMVSDEFTFVEVNQSLDLTSRTEYDSNDNSPQHTKKKNN
ncbi:HER122Wp [Eremothecium sinecaudum]|uniref:HER122Wp n=1 Tax=Eremothecium sinecaudum TaxID=45286 RepID=A0A0X8HT86_9SACH|nr:HER122Wp [Eremothecium sinecaudum]AMD21401.1 HER122Wp [Eremothecium sinecaudum]